MFCARLPDVVPSSARRSIALEREVKSDPDLNDGVAAAAMQSAPGRELAMRVPGPDEATNGPATPASKHRRTLPYLPEALTMARSDRLIVRFARAARTPFPKCSRQCYRSRHPQADMGATRELKTCRSQWSACSMPLL